MFDYLITFIHGHLEFRLPELLSLAKLENVTMEYDASTLSDNSPFLKVRLESDEDAKKLIRRAILIKEIALLWTEALTFEELLQNTRAIPGEVLQKYKTCSFKFQIHTFGVSLTIPQQVERIEQFSFLPFDGEINLKTPDVVFSVYEDYKDFAARSNLAPPEKPVHLYFGVLLACGDRALINKFTLKKRHYIGITSMDAELSLIMSNQALVKENSFVLDPFVGTGSFLFTTAHYGAFSLGSDIDGRQIRGKDGKDITSTAEQYNLMGRILGNVVCDIAHHPWRDVEFWDAIVCDPPYGVRAGAKTIAVNPKLPPKVSLYNKNGTLKLPQTLPYELDDVLVDLLDFAARFLVPGGRLVYWLPTIPESYTDEDVPRHKRMRMIANSEQSFGKWARRMVTMEKLLADEPDIDLTGWVYAKRAGAAALLSENPGGEGESSVPAPAHAKFREVYFSAKEGEANDDRNE